MVELVWPAQLIGKFGREVWSGLGYFSFFGYFSEHVYCEFTRKVDLGNLGFWGRSGRQSWANSDPSGSFAPRPPTVILV